MKNILFIAAIIALTLTSCFDWACIDGNGDFTIEERETGAFNEIEVDGSFDVYLTQDSVTKVTVNADENIQGYISTKVSEGRLIVKSRRDRCFNSDHQVKVTVSTPSVNYILLAGSGMVECNEIETQNLDVVLDGSGSIYLDNVFADNVDYNLAGSGYIESFIDAETADLSIDGSGEIKVSGSVISSDLLITGSGKIRAGEMDSEESYATVTGSGDIYTSVSDLLDAKITGSGNIFYYGNPSHIVKTITGSGKIVKKN